MTVAALVLAGGSSRRLGRPKQLLDLGGMPLLQHGVDVVRAATTVDRVIVALGHAADQVEAAVDLAGCLVVRTTTFEQGCAGSLAAGVGALGGDPVEGVVLVPGDQPGLDPTSIDSLVATGRAGAEIAVCRYQDQVGHPFWFDRSLLGELGSLGGDKAAWKLIESGRWPVTTLPVPGPCPRDVDTWDDYRAVLTGDRR